jgi:hypothetical protein
MIKTRYNNAALPNGGKPFTDVQLDGVPHLVCMRQLPFGFCVMPSDRQVQAADTLIFYTDNTSWAGLAELVQYVASYFKNNEAHWNEAQLAACANAQTIYIAQFNDCTTLSFFNEPKTQAEIAEALQADYVAATNDCTGDGLEALAAEFVAWINSKP